MEQDEYLYRNGFGKYFSETADFEEGKKRQTAQGIFLASKPIGFTL